MQQGKKSRRFRGDVITLTKGHYAAGVAVVGATLEWLKYDGRNIVRPNLANAYAQDDNGIVSVPWPHYATNDTYTIQEKKYWLPSESEELFHGLGCSREFKIREKSKNSVKLSHYLWAQPSYPFPLEITVIYTLDSVTGLETTVTSRNCGEHTAPYGVSGNFYVIAGPEPMRTWTVTVPHTWVQRMEFGTPLPIETADSSPNDMRAGQVIRRPIASRHSVVIRRREVDASFGGLELDGDGRWRATVTAPGGTGVEVSAGYCCPWVGLLAHGDDSYVKDSGKGFAVRPSTCPAGEVFSSGIVIEPGESHTASWRIRALEGSTASTEADEGTACEHQAPSFPSD